MTNICKDLNTNLASYVYVIASHIFLMFVLCMHIKRVEAKVLHAIVVQPTGPMLEKENAMWS